MNWGLVGHEWAVSLLKEQMVQSRLRHAYLFTGPGGIGRRTTAVRLAQALNCAQPLSDGEPCLACSVCKRINNNGYPDLTVVQSESPGRVLKVDQIRELQRIIALSPYESQYRIVVLLRFEEASSEAANALLKTLEEPGDKVILILTADAAENLPPTVVSRCEVMRFRPPAVEELSEWLAKNLQVSREDADLFAHISSGAPGRAIQLHQEPDQLKKRNEIIREFYDLLNSDRVYRFKYISRFDYPMDLPRSRKELTERISVWFSFWRDVLLCASGASLPYSNIDQKERLEVFADKIGLGNARHLVSETQKVKDLLEKNINPRLAAEELLLNYPFDN
ncbi:MAG: DNA polymerase III subunit delta' [Anaerolineales bacterium]|jgi:DNA polymerase-3 subunit delta'